MIKFLPLVWSNLWRLPLRTALALLSLVAAFALLGLAQALDAMFTLGYSQMGESRLYVQSRVSFVNPLPVALAPRLDAIAGVKAVMGFQRLRSYHQDPKNVFGVIPVEPQRWKRALAEWQLPEEQYRAWLTTKTGIIVGRRLAERYGWKVGDKVPITIERFPRKNGSRSWEFDIVGIFHSDSAVWDQQNARVYVRYDHFDEERLFGQGYAGAYLLQLDDPARAEAIAREIDAMTANSSYETKTRTETADGVERLRALGNVSLLARGIIAAVFFAILLGVGSVMAQAFRERVPELGTLKALGFSDRTVGWLVLGESMLLCVLGGVCGLALSAPAMELLARAAPMLPVAPIGVRVWLPGLLAMLLLGLAVGLPSWLQARRLSIAQALAA
jgi:putative ABC transport system permease protein